MHSFHTERKAAMNQAPQRVGRMGPSSSRRYGRWTGAQLSCVRSLPPALAPGPAAVTVRASRAPRPATAAAAVGAAAAAAVAELATPPPLEPAEEAGPGSWVPPAGRPGLYDSDVRLVLKALTLPELEAWCAAEGEPSPANRALQLWRWMYADPPAGAWVRSLEETLGRQNGFSAKFVEKVGPRVTLDGGLALQRVVRASDGTRKLVFGLTGGPAAGGSIEAVLIPVVRRAGLRDRLTICVSSQVGCAMNCQFCYTGRMGLLGNLTTAQIVEQVVEARRFLAEEGDRTPLTNLVFMGMGEPLHNTEAVLAAAEIMGHYLGLHISHNKMTISTVGLVPEMRAVLARSRVQMALSLHATTDEVRDWIVPVNRRYDLATLTSALEELFPKPPAGEGPAGEETDRGAAAEVEAAGPGQGPVEAAAAEAGASASGPAAQAGTGSGCCSAREGPGSRAAGTVQSAASSSSSLSVPSPSSSSSAASGQPAQPGSGPDLSTGKEPSISGRWLPPLEPSHPAASASAAGVSGGGVSSDGGAAAERSGGAASSSSSSSGGGGGQRGDRSLLVEYTMLHGINDTLEDAERLAGMLSRVNCKVNLIVFNPHAGTRFRPSTDEDITAFRSALIQRGLVCTIRDSRGDDEMAACGQLGNVGLAFRPSPLLEPPERFRQFLLPPPAVPLGSQAAR